LFTLVGPLAKVIPNGIQYNVLTTPVEELIFKSLSSNSEAPKRLLFIKEIAKIKALPLVLFATCVAELLIRLTVNSFPCGNPISSLTYTFSNLQKLYRI